MRVCRRDDRVRDSCMSDYCFEVLDANDDVQLFFDGKISELLSIYSDRGMERLLQNL